MFELETVPHSWKIADNVTILTSFVKSPSKLFFGEDIISADRRNMYCVCMLDVVLLQRRKSSSKVQHNAALFFSPSSSLFSPFCKVCQVPIKLGSLFTR